MPLGEWSELSMFESFEGGGARRWFNPSTSTWKSKRLNTDLSRISVSSMMALHSRYDKVPFSPEECRMDKRGIRDFADDVGRQ